MEDGTYHELARLEHDTKARVYARYGMRRKAASHASRAAYHASFGGPIMRERDKRTESPVESATGRLPLPRAEYNWKQRIGSDDGSDSGSDSGYVSVHLSDRLRFFFLNCNYCDC